jgi:hypothetical protein
MDPALEMWLARLLFLLVGYLDLSEQVVGGKEG